MPISRLKRVPVRNVWPKEERNFTPWLEANVDLLSETLGIELSSVERERKVGESFEADLLLESEGHFAVVENQFGKSDHDHLGKLITYLTNLEAKTAIWICEDPRPEHKETVDWLNKTTPPDISFYLIKLEAFQIENSPHAPHLSIVSAPSKAVKDAGGVTRAQSETVEKRREFWKQLKERSKEKTELFSNVSPSGDLWLTTGAGISGVQYTYIILKNESRVLLEMNSSDEEINKRRFDKLFRKKPEIEASCGALTWQRLDDLKSSRIVKSLGNKGLSDEENWPNLQNKMIEAMVKLEATFRDYLRELT